MIAEFVSVGDFRKCCEFWLHEAKMDNESNGGVVYLKGERDTVYGINKYILMCNTSKMILHVVFDPQRRDSWFCRPKRTLSLSTIMRRQSRQ